MTDMTAKQALEMLADMAHMEAEEYAKAGGGGRVESLQAIIRNHLTDPGYARVPVEHLRKLTGLVDIVEGFNGAMCHGTWRDDKGFRLKDTAEWVSYYCAAKETSHD